MKRLNLFTIALSVALIMTLLFACNEQPTNVETEDDEAYAKASSMEQSPAERGKYLVTASVCNDCHTPKKFNENGFEPDYSRTLAGHTPDSPVPPVDPKATKPGNWVLMSPGLTAFVGPWGISYAANLTPDSTTGIGAWTQEQFIQTLRTGKHLGMAGGRDVLPPMPWVYFRNYSDEDLKAIFAYLRSLPAISNRVPAPVPPNEVGKG